MSEIKSTAGVLIIATNKYWQFVQPLLDSINKYFLPDNNLVIHLFIDEYREYKVGERMSMKQYFIEPYKFPYASLYRYQIFRDNIMLSNEDYLYYLDADMLITDTIGTEILNELTVVHHPGFYSNNGWGSPNVDERSTAYFPAEKRKEYVAGGFNGASAKEFMKISNILAHNISIDEDNGVMAEYHDETHLNKLISTMSDRSKLVVLDSSYCQPEQPYLQKAWKIDHLPKRIIALSKDHQKIRS